MRTLAIAVLLVTPVLQAQESAEPGLSRKVEIPVGSSAKRAVFNLHTRPAPGDRFVVTVDTAKLHVALIAPDGQRITQTNAEYAGLTWSEMALTAPLGSTDGGLSTAIEFVKPGKAGPYTIEFTGNPIGRSAHADVQFVSDSKEDENMLKSLSGYQTLGPITLTKKDPAATLQMTLDHDEEGAIFDIVINDPGADVSVTLPDGRSIGPTTKNTAGLEWRTFKDASEMDEADSFLNLSSMLLHRPGTHHVVGFEKAKRGRYQITAHTSGARAAELAAAFIPLGSIFKEAENEMKKLGSAPPGEVRLKPYATFPYDCYVGDKLDVVVGFTGDPVDTSSLKFSVRLEYKEIKPRFFNGAVEYTTPVVVPEQMTLERNADGLYAGSFAPRQTGIMRVSVRVTGKTTGGKPFSDETLLTDVNVHRVAATFQGLSEKAVDTQGKGTFDRLDIAAHLDVTIPGEYEMRLSVHGAGGAVIGGTNKQTLAAGRQTLTVSIPASKLRELKDGPWTISEIQIFHPIGNSFGDSVPTGRLLSLRTAPYSRDQWDRGGFWGEDSVTVRGIRPDDSGRFRMLEIQWKVFTPGGHCGWTASLDGEHLGVDGTLPKGSAVVSFVFDGAAIAAEPKHDWYFMPILNCDFGSVSGGGPRSLLHVSPDPAEFEPQHGTFRVTTQRMVQLAAGGFTMVAVGATGKKPPEAPPPPRSANYFNWRDPVNFQVMHSFPGVEVTIPAQSSAAPEVMVQVRATAEAKPGRYFIPIAATAKSETATMDLVVDVVDVQETTSVKH